ncbi:nuclear receptor coactivator 6 [Anabrus simplex]|uniref:nuclear receptor coactivator 6 n=1 Tax=Anabrus simplex TaxID=316456 RepID=UPI0034DD6F70
MNNVLGEIASEIEKLINEESNDSVLSQSQEAHNASPPNNQHYRCRDCENLAFSNREEFEVHLLTHVQLPYIPVQRLKRSFVLQIKSNKSPSPVKRGAFARKRIRSYIVPKSGSLKLTLKRFQQNKSSPSESFKVVQPKILSGPGESYLVNGEIPSEVKTEDTEREEVSTRSVEGSGDKRVEGGEVAETDRGTPHKTATVGKDKEQTKTRKESESGSSGSDSGDDAGCDNITDVTSLVGEDKLDIEEAKLESESVAPTPSVLSPNPIDQVGSEFLPSEGAGSSPNMVEVNGSTLAEAPSPAYPSTSPGVPQPPTPSNESQMGMNGDESLNSQQILPGPEQVRCEDQSEAVENDAQQSFSWNSVVSSNVEGIHSDSANSGPLEDRDPLLLPDQGAPPPSSSGEEDSGVGMDLNQDSGALESGDSLLRGFLCEQPPDKTAVPVTNVGNIEGLGLGSEFMEIERLGEGLVYCDVCGESASDHQALEDHRTHAGHFKCSQAECGMVFPTGDELMAHQQTMHGNQSYGQPPMMNHQQAPVQQLVQQVQRLPVPQMSMQSMGQQQQLSPQQLSPQQQHSPQMVQQLSPQMHTLMPPQQNQFQGSVRRPPPLYRGPSPASMAAPGMSQHAPYSGQQPMMYSQAYQQGQAYQQPGQGTIQPRPYSNMIQQLNHQQTRPQLSHRMPGPSQRAPQPGSQGSANMGMKRAQGPNAAGSPSNKQRRLDVLIPDRHDDADCHVIAMQKRTDSGPVIGNVQGSSGNTSVSSSNRPDSMIHLTDSITLSVRQPQPGQTNVPANVGKKSDAKAVANILATRGITVTPAGGAVRTSQGQQSPQRQIVNRNQQQSAPPAPVPTLNLNAAISIIPTASGRQTSRQQSSSGNFQVPQGRSPARVQQQPVERPPRPPTVDLTGDGPPSSSLQALRNRGRGRSTGIPGRYVCQVCDKVFSTQESLNQHMNMHRSPGKLPFRCSLCSAQYPTQQGLLQHRQAYHKETSPQPGSELALPIVDLKQPGTLSRLAGLGVHHYIPLSQLSNSSGGYYGLPIVSLDGSRPPVCNLSGLGSSAVLSLGPIKQLPR